MLKTLFLLALSIGSLAAASVSSAGRFLKLTGFDSTNPDGLVAYLQKSAISSLMVMKADNQFVIRITTTEVAATRSGATVSKVYSFSYRTSDDAQRDLDAIVREIHR